MALKDLTGIYADIYKHQKDNALKDGIAELQTKVTALAALANDLKAKYNAAVTLINELKTDLSAHTTAGLPLGRTAPQLGQQFLLLIVRQLLSPM